MDELKSNAIVVQRQNVVPAVRRGRRKYTCMLGPQEEYSTVHLFVRY